MGIVVVEWEAPPSLGDWTILHLTVVRISVILLTGLTLTRFESVSYFPCKTFTQKSSENSASVVAASVGRTFQRAC